MVIAIIVLGLNFGLIPQFIRDFKMRMGRSNADIIPLELKKWRLSRFQIFVLYNCINV